MKPSVFLLFVLLGTVSFSQNGDSTQALFKGAKYSYAQIDLGYAGTDVNGHRLHGTDFMVIGVVLNKVWCTGLGFGFGFDPNSGNYMIHLPPPVEAMTSTYWNNEILIRPDKLINFSIPFRIARTGVTTWDTLPPTTSQMISNWNFTGVDYYQHAGSLWTATAGANVLLNVFKPLSLGIGANYRTAFGVPSRLGKASDYAGYTINIFLRIKWDTRAYMKKAIERQQEYMKKMAK